MKATITFLFLLGGFVNSHGQCDQIGQSPWNAYPVCNSGPTTHYPNLACGSREIYVPPTCTPAAKKLIRNQYFFKFTCYRSGWFSFMLNSLNETYNWMLYDVTDVNLFSNELFTRPDIIVSGNFNGGIPLGDLKLVTGMTGQGTTSALVPCPQPDPLKTASAITFLQDIYEGHRYLLMVCHDDPYFFPYTVNFPITYPYFASITNPMLPHLQSANTPCDGTLTAIKLNKPILCSSISADGSDFEIFPPLANVIAARGIGCNNYFETDSIHIYLDKPLPTGSYTVAVKKGTDGNTLVDECTRQITEGEKITLAVNTFTQTLMDSLTTLTCATDTLQLVFKRKMKCNTVSADGTDFRISGPAAVNIVSAAGVDCDDDGLTRKIKIKLAGPIHSNGQFTIQLVAGTDGNTLLNECGIATPANGTINFDVKDTVSAGFIFRAKYGCVFDTVSYANNAINETNNWKWSFDSLQFSNLQNPVILYKNFGDKKTQLVVSNGVCSDTASASFTLSNIINASFEATPVLCPGDKAFFTNYTTGDGPFTWQWIFENGLKSAQEQPPPQTYAVPQASSIIRVKLIATNFLGCNDTAYQHVTLSHSCFIAVPGAFTPNNDGRNDYLYPLVAYKARNLKFSVYNRSGQLVFYSTNRNHKWDGNVGGQPADAGTYVWTLSYTDADTNKNIFQKGTSILIR